MTKHFRTLMMAFVAVATMGIVSCGKDKPTPENPDNPGDDPGNVVERTELGGTSWNAIYNDTYMGSYPAVMNWSLDFTSNTEGSLLLELSIAGQDQNPANYDFTYTFSNNHGVVTLTGVGQFTFDYHPESNTITADIGIGTEDGGQMGGLTTFYPRGTTPVPGGGNNGGGNGGGSGEITNEFPANTTWTSYEQATYQGNMVDIYYEMYFRNDHTGGVDITLEVGGNTQPAQTQNFTWIYNSNNESGSVTIQGHGIAFYYDATNDQIQVSFPFGFSQTETFGSNLVFERSN